MRILFDNNAPNPIAQCLGEHEIAFARRIGWHELKNGELLRQAEEAGFDVLVTADKNMGYQQNLGGRRIAIVVLGTQQWPAVRQHLERIREAVNGASPGSYVEVAIPYLE